MNRVGNLVFCALLLSLSCSDDANPGERAYRFVGYDPVGYAANAPDSTVISFLKWYRKHEDPVCRIDFIKGGLEDKTTFYHIDFYAVERFLHELRKSGLLSEKYLSDLRKYIRDRDQDLKTYPQNDGPAFGFEGDIVMKAQDYMHVWEGLPYAVVLAKKINGYKAAIDLAVASFHTMHFDLVLVDGTWKIDSLYHVWNTRPVRLNFH